MRKASSDENPLNGSPPPQGRTVVDVTRKDDLVMDFELPWDQEQQWNA